MELITVSVCINNLKVWWLDRLMSEVMKSPSILPPWVQHTCPAHETWSSLILYSSTKWITLIMSMYCLTTLARVHCSANGGEMTPRLSANLLCPVCSTSEGNLRTGSWALKPVFAKTASSHPPAPLLHLPLSVLLQAIPSSGLTSLPKGSFVWRT